MAQAHSSFFKQIGAWPLYAWLVAAYPVVALYSVNIGLVMAGEFWLALGVTLAAFTLLVGLLSALLRSIQRGAVTASIIASGFFTMGHFWLLLYSGKLDATSRVPQWLLPAWVAGTALLAGLAAWRLPASGLKKAAPSLNLVLIGLVAFTSARIVQSIGQDYTGASNEASLQAPKVMNDAQHPDVYYLILDGYSANKHYLRDWGYDNSAFTDELEKRGFYVAYDSKSNYGVTLASMASSLNMRYLSADEKPANDPSGVGHARTLIADSEVAKQFMARGYIYIFIMSGFDHPSTIADYNMDFFFEGGMRLYPRGTEVPADTFPSEPFVNALLTTTMLADPKFDAGFSNLAQLRNPLVIPYERPQRALHTWRQTARIAERPEATFTIAHILKPHNPMVFDRDGNILTKDVPPEDAERVFFDQLTFVNNRTLRMIDEIMEKSSVPPIIIIQGDHGTRLGNPNNPSGRLVYFEILNAYYFPNGGADNLYSDISPVNSFRVMFNTYFGGAYDLLADEQYETIGHYRNLFKFELYKPPGQ